MMSRIATVFACLVACVSVAMQTPYARSRFPTHDTQASETADVSAKADGQRGKPAPTSRR